MKTVILAPGMIFNCLKYMESLLHALLARSDAAFLHCWPCMTSFMTSLGSYEFFVNNSRSNWARESTRSPMNSGRPAESNDMRYDLLRPTSWFEDLWPDLTSRSRSGWPYGGLTWTKVYHSTRLSKANTTMSKSWFCGHFLRSYLPKTKPAAWVTLWNGALPDEIDAVSWYV